MNYVINLRFVEIFSELTEAMYCTNYYVCKEFETFCGYLVHAQAKIFEYSS